MWDWGLPKEQLYCLCTDIQYIINLPVVGYFIKIDRDADTVKEEWNYLYTEWCHIRLWIWALLWFREGCDILRRKTQSRVTITILILILSWPLDWFQWKHTTSHSILTSEGLWYLFFTRRCWGSHIKFWQQNILSGCFPFTRWMPWSEWIIAYLWDLWHAGLHLYHDLFFHAFPNIPLCGCSGKSSHLSFSFAEVKQLIVN